MSDHNKAVLRRFLEDVWNRGDVAVLREIVADDCRFRSNQIAPTQGADGMGEVVTGLREAFPDGKFTVEEMVAEGDSVAQRWTFRGTQKGQWLGQPATGKKVEVTGTTISHLKNGKMVEHLADWDAMGMMQQLGVIEA